MSADKPSEYNQPTDSQQVTSSPADESNPTVRRNALRALILGSIAAGGAFQLNGWQSQAHGNRSSGAVQSIRTPVLSDVEIRRLLSEPLAPAQPNAAPQQTPTPQQQR